MTDTTKRLQGLLLSSAALGLALAALGMPVVAKASASDLPPGPTLALICRACNENGSG